MNRILGIIAVAVLLTGVAAAKVEVVIASGIGSGSTAAEASLEALRAAQLEAIEMVTGVEITKTALESVQLEFYQVFVKTKGVIVKHKDVGTPIIVKYKDVGTPVIVNPITVRRTIKAWVKDIDQSALADFAKWNHRVGLRVLDPMFAQKPAMTALQNKLETAGYDVVDLAKARVGMSRLFDKRDADLLVRKYLVNAVIEARPRIKSGFTGDLGRETGVISIRAKGTTRLVFVKDLDVVHREEIDTKAIGPTAVKTRLRHQALRKYGDRAADLMLPRLNAEFPATRLSVTMHNMKSFTMYHGIHQSLAALLTDARVKHAHFSPLMSTIAFHLKKDADPIAISTTVGSFLVAQKAKILSLTPGSVVADFGPPVPAPAAVPSGGTDSVLIYLGIGILVLLAIAVLLLLRRK
jgi:hypothetical protein